MILALSKNYFLNLDRVHEIAFEDEQALIYLDQGCEPIILEDNNDRYKTLRAYCDQIVRIQIVPQNLDELSQRVEVVLCKHRARNLDYAITRLELGRDIINALYHPVQETTEGGDADMKK